MVKKIAVIVSGYFNHILKGRLEYINKAKDCADKLFVIVNSDHQRELKGNKAFQGEEERMIVVGNVRAVDETILSIDKDRTVIKSIEKIWKNHSKKYNQAFANSADLNNDKIPERAICGKLNIQLLDNLGDKIQSSSWLLKNK